MNSRDAAIRIVTVAALASCVGLAEAAARIELFSPTGYSKDVRQVAVRFSAPMVALGDPTRASPFAVDCAVPGTGRWLDERRWVYDFDYDVPGSVRCRFTLRDDVRSHAGEAIDAAPRDEGAEYVFHTGGPAILDHEPGRRWDEIDEHQVFLLALDATPVLDSVREHARCRVVGEESRPVELLLGADRAEVLDALWDDDDVFSGNWSTRRAVICQRATMKKLATGPSSGLWRCAAPGIRVPQRVHADVGALPNGSDVELIWSAGIEGIGGLATTRSDSLKFLVRPEFRATLECLQTHEGRCFGGVHVAFSALVRRELAGSVRLADGDDNAVVGETREESQIQRVDFPDADQEGSVYHAELLGSFVDIDGRALANAASFPQTVRIGSPPPTASFGNGRLLVVESGGTSTAPVLLQGVRGFLSGRRMRVTDDTEVVRWIRRLADAQEERDPGLPGSPWRRSLIGGRGQPFALPVIEREGSPQVAGVPVVAPGLQILEVHLPPADGLPRRYVAGLAMATDLGVHFHRGAVSSLVWVTRLSNSAPVAGADVRISDGCTGRLLARTTTDADGLARFPEAFPDVACESGRHYVASVRKNGEVAVVTSAGRPYPGGNAVVHTILDRTLFQPGETVSMKVVVRHPTADGLAIPEELPAEVRVTIEGAAAYEHQLTLDLAANGSAVGSFQLPESVPLGYYLVSVALDGNSRWGPYFRVERFKVGTMRATVGVPEGPLVNPRSVPIDLSIEHMSGSGAASQSATVRTRLIRWRRYTEDLPSPPESDTLDVVLDAAGRARVELPLPEIDRESTLYVELDYRDANGQARTARNSVDLWPAAVALTVSDAWEAGGRKWVQVRARRPDEGAATGVVVEAKVYSPRTGVDRRLPGGFRGTYYGSPSRLLASCSGTTDANGTMACEVPSDLPRSVVVEATAQDAQGNADVADGSLWFRTWGADAPLLELDTEGEYAVGETVPVRVNLPFSDATALVTIQREGVIDAFVERLQGPDAVLEIPVRRRYVPNVDVSLLAIRGRTGTKKPGGVGAPGAASGPDAPDYRHGSVKLRVGLDTHTLTVRVEPDRDTYRVREHARVRVTVEGPDGRPRADAEVALVAVDEALLDIWPNPTWDLLDAMMGIRTASINSQTNLDRLKATLSFGSIRAGVEDASDLGGTLFSSGLGVNANAAAYAPAEPVPRRDFGALLHWRGRLSMGTDGAAEVDIAVNDLLTSFRIVAVATAGEDLFGTGEATIRATQDLVLHWGLPDTVREGDHFDAVFTVRNASDRTHRVSVVAEVDEIGELSEQRLRLRPGRSREVSWPVTVPSRAEALSWEVTASSRSAVDRLAARQTVEPLVPVRAQQTTLAHLAAPRQFAVAPPASALPGRSGVRVSLEPTLLGSLVAVREAMASAGAALDPATMLLRFFPARHLRGSPELTAYVLTVADAAGKVVPEALGDYMIDGLKTFLDGRIVHRRAFPTADGQLRRLTAMAALARHGELPRATVDELDLDVEQLPTSGLLDWIDILARVEDDGGELHRAKAILRSRLNLQGTTMEFSTENRDRLWWLMVSTDGNAARAILSVLGDPEWHTDAPRMIRGLFGRQQRGRWETTVANAWGTVAARQFAAVFDVDPVSGASIVRLGDEEQRVNWSDTTADAESSMRVDVPWSSAAKLTLDHEGTGTPWALVQLRAAVPTVEPVRAGYRIERQVERVLRDSPDTWQRGDVARVELTITADADMTWVVVEDPIPPGAVILGSGLGDDSALLSQGGMDDIRPVFVERDFTNYRAYFHYVPKGTFTVGYSVRYNTAGDFHLPPSRVEAMYMPEMFGEQPVAAISIR